jgi:hypothetical protein
MLFCRLLLFKTAILRRNIACSARGYFRRAKPVCLAVVLAVLGIAAAAKAQTDIGLRSTGGAWQGPVFNESIALEVYAVSPQPYSLFGDESGYNDTSPTGIPGDIVFLNNTESQSPANWYGVISFFNPADPTGSQGLPATEMEAYFPDDLGPAGFAGFSLLPDDYYLAPPAAVYTPGTMGSFFDTSGPYAGFESELATDLIVGFDSPRPRTRIHQPAGSEQRGFAPAETTHPIECLNKSGRRRQAIGTRRRNGSDFGNPH